VAVHDGQVIYSDDGLVALDEGGEDTASHLHISRRYNGEWIAADGFAPFVLSGWTAHAGPTPYKGTLTKGDRTIVRIDAARGRPRALGDDMRARAAGLQRSESATRGVARPML
jgi:hypothetical protein